MARNLRVGVQRGLRQSIGGGLGAGDIFTLSPALFDFSRTNTKDSRITFTRASSGTFVAGDGLIKTSSVNLIKYSQKFDQQWTTDSTGTITINHAEAPNGTTTANRFVESTGNSSHAIRQTLTVSGTYTVSTHFKELPGSAKRYGVLRIHGVGSTAPIAFFDLGNGTVTSSGGTNIISTSITDVGDGWFRCSMTANEPLLSGDGIQIGVTNASDSFSSYAGDGSSGLLIWGVQIEEGSTATTYIPTTSTISGAPRYENGELLLEPARINHLNHSASPSLFNTLITVPAPSQGFTAPDGSTDAYQYPVNSTNRLQLNLSVPAGQTYTISFFAKQGDGTNLSGFIGFVTGGQRDPNGSIYNWTTGVLQSGWTKEDYANGWSKFYKSYTSTTGTLFVLNINDSEGVLFWGFQLEYNSSFPTSYIPTSGSAVTRAADVSTSALGVDSFFNPVETTYFVDVVRSYSGGFSSYPQVCKFHDEPDNNKFTCYGVLNTDKFTNNSIKSGGVNQTSYVQITANFPGPTRLAQAAAVNSSMFAGNGGLTTEDTSVTMPVGIDRLSIGFKAGYLRRLTYWPERLPNATLQTITN